MKESKEPEPKKRGGKQRLGAAMPKDYKTQKTLDKEATLGAFERWLSISWKRLPPKATLFFPEVG